MTVTMVVGAATPPRRLASAVENMARLMRERPDAVETEVINLATTTMDTCDGRALDAYSQETQGAVQAIARASAVLIASPVYRASFPGVLKNLLDLLPVDTLRGKPVAILALGTSPHHYLAVDNHLRQVLAWFGALVTPTSVYLTSKDFSEGRLATDTSIADLRALADTLLLLARSIDGRDLGPPPLAAKFA